MKVNYEQLREFEKKYEKKIEKNKPKFCPSCGARGLDAVVLYDIKPNEITVIYDCYCEKCGWSGDISPDSVANIEFKSEVEEDVCCVCGHPLWMHIDERNGWRCHALGPDGYQCECFLRKDKAKGDISYYSLEKRVKEFKRELKKEIELLLKDDF